MFSHKKAQKVQSFCGNFPVQAKGEWKWDRVNGRAEPRSAYHLSGPAHSEWEHSILRVDALRYSITFRTMRT